MPKDKKINALNVRCWV